MTCFVSKPSRITLVELPIINTSYQKLPFGSGDYPDTAVVTAAGCCCCCCCCCDSAGQSQSMVYDVGSSRAGPGIVYTVILVYVTGNSGHARTVVPGSRHLFSCIRLCRRFLSGIVRVVGVGVR